jgi:hypothetical protein
VIDFLDIRFQGGSGHPPKNRHEELEQAKMKRQTEGRPRPSDLGQRARGYANCEGVHGHAQRKEQKLKDLHAFSKGPAVPTSIFKPGVDDRTGS